MKSYEIKNKNILIFGGTGSLGKSLIKYYLNSGNNVTCFSRDEAKHWTLKNTFKSDKLTFIVGDIRDKNRVQQSLKIAKPNIIIIAAALKQVPSCEFHPIEAVKTNVMGTENVLTAAINTNVKRVICLSTDKAVYPITAMGISKALMEKVFLSKSRQDSSNTVFCGTRY